MIRTLTHDQHVMINGSGKKWNSQSIEHAEKGQWHTHKKKKNWAFSATIHKGWLPEVEKHCLQFPGPWFSSSHRQVNQVFPEKQCVWPVQYGTCLNKAGNWF